MRYWINQAVRRDESFRGLFADAEIADVEAYYDASPASDRTPLVQAPRLAASIGIRGVSVKDESGRFGLTAFKIVGARYAMDRIDGLGPAGVVCATAGNHGRAVARVARERGLPCTVFVPAAGSLSAAEGATRQRRLTAMQQDHASVVEVPGTYEDAVRAATTHGRERGATIVSDVSWEGYEAIPRLIMAGYTRIFEEASAQWERPPDLVLVQGGVGGLVCAAASWFAHRYAAARPTLVACEPEHAACLLASARTGAPVTLTGPLDTIMAGLRCASPSPLAWPAIRDGIDAFVAVPDTLALEAMEALTRETPPLHAGPSGACGVAALLALAREAAFAPLRRAIGFDQQTRALVVVTEGP